jgi:uncharacterized protein (TIGR02145 family)
MEGGSIAAVMEDIQTRTAVTDQGIFTWSAGDKVWLEITANPGYVTGTLSTGAGTGSANFAYGSYFGDMTGKAIYPFNTGHDISGDQLSVVLPATYDLGSNLGNTNAAMYGVETSGKIKFNHLAGVMRFNFRSVPAGVNKFVITLDKKINGTFTADLTEDHPVLQTESTSDESEKTITLNFDDLTQTQDISIYVPLPLGTYTTLELALMDDDETVWDYSNTITNTVNRKSLLLMPTVNVTGSISGDLEGGDVVEGENPSDAQEGDYVDEYGINHGQGVEIDGVIWAPVNCGYHATDYKYGKLYQWGRKYGQGYDSNDATVPSIVRGPEDFSVVQQESNSNKFYSSMNSDFDWIYGGSRSLLWNSGSEENPIKTEYDPCPDGWRVPTYSEIGALKANSSSWATNDVQNGYWFSGSNTYSESVHSVFLPAAGYRLCGDGNISGTRGTGGDYWSSSPNNNDTYYLSFSSGGLVNVSYYHRASGYSVRCVHEDSLLDVPEEPSEPTPSQPSYSVQLTPSTYGWLLSTSVSNPDASLYDGVYESTNQGRSSTKSIMYIDIDGYDTFTFYVRSYAESQYDYVIVSNLDVDITNSTSGFKMTTSGNQQSGTSLSSYTEVTFTNIGGGQHRIMVAYKKDHSVDNGNDKGYVLIPKNQNQGSTPEVPSEPQDGDYIDEYGINHGQGVEIDGVVWAPVNCGYHATDYKYGKLYQWGRKYGQGYEGVLWDVNGNQSGTYADASLPSFVSGPVSLSVGQSSSNSNKYYESTSSPWDWVTPQNDELWNSGTETNPVKTEYDPCPEGWRVPTYAELNNLKENYSSWTTHDNQNGLWFSGSASYSQSVSSVFLPAAGYPDINGGDDRGIRGWYWSSRVSDNRACGMDVYYGCANMYEGGRRMDGSSVRCVQE